MNVRDGFRNFRATGVVLAHGQRPQALRASAAAVPAVAVRVDRRAAATGEMSAPRMARLGNTSCRPRGLLLPASSIPEDKE